MFRETTTLGIRVSYEEREELERWTEAVATHFGPIQVKRGRLGDGKIKTAPEYEACRAAAKRYRVPLANVYDAAERAAGEGRARARRPRARGASGTRKTAAGARARGRRSER
jgi:uncharacterized protein (DUF111 family)